MSNRTMMILLSLFIAGLFVIWLRSEPDSDPESKLVETASLLPPVFSEFPRAVDRLVIEGDPDGRIVLERTGPSHWERLEPSRGWASTMHIEAFLQGLRELRPLAGSGDLDGPPSRYGLERPERIFRASHKGQEVAVLREGASVAGAVYIRAGDGPIQAVDAHLDRLIYGLTSRWREDNPIPISSWLDVRSLTIRYEGSILRIERNANGNWRFVEPTKAPVDTQTILNVIMRLSSARLGEPVPAASAVGLDQPWLQVSVMTEEEGEWGFSVGEEIPGRPEWYAVRRDRDPEILSLPAEVLDLMPKTPVAFRSRRAMVFRPDRVRALAVIEEGSEHLVIRDDAKKWRLERPDRAPADGKVVNDLLKTLSSLDTLAIYSPEDMPNSGVETPEVVVKLWLGEPGTGAIPKADDPGDRSIAIGRWDAGRKQVYARTGGDTSILALLESFPAEIPRGDLAFRNRALQAIEPGSIVRIMVEQGGSKVVVVSGGEPGDYASWRMERPAAARVDARAVATLDLLLSRLRASSLIDTGNAPVDLARFGLDKPVARVSWTLRPEGSQPWGERGTLHIGAAVSASDDRRYAMLDGRPGVFTLEPRAVSILTAELHDRTVLSYPPEHVARVSLTWPGRPSWVIERRPRPFEGVDWVTVSGSGPRGLPIADIAPMAARLALLTTDRFAQYEGPHRPEFGLDAPALAVEVSLSGGLGSRWLRIGASAPGKSRYAAAGTSDQGPVFLVPEEPWAPWLNPPDAVRSAPPSPELPASVFAPGG